MKSLEPESTENQQVAANPRANIGWIGVFLAIGFLVTGNILNKIIANEFDGASLDRFLNPLFMLSYVCLISRGFVWIAALKFLPISTAYPFMSLSFPIILIVSQQLFGEAVTIPKIAGTVLIVVGVLLVGRKQ
ncbi:small multidrug resistance protein [Calditrichota bacterium]